MVLAWENLRRFLWCWSSFCCCCCFICWCSSFTFSFRHHPSPFSGLSPGFYTHFILLAQSIAEWFVILSFSTIPLSSYRERYGFEWALFYPQALFYLTLLHWHFTCVYQGLPGSRQFFLEVCRASYWSSKHRPGPSVCLIHSNPQSFLHLKSVFMHVNIAKVLLVVKTLIRSAATLFTSHENIKQLN